jgi:streptogramin lyase
VIDEVVDVGGEELLGLEIADGAVWAISYQAGSISRIDPATGQVVLTKTLGMNAATVVAGDELWVAGYGVSPADSHLFRIDPASGEVLGETPVGEVCCDLAVGAGRIWAIDPRGDVVGVDPGRDRVEDRYAVPFDREVHTNVVFGGGSLWVGSDGTALVEVDPATGEIRRTIDTPGGPPFLQDDGLVWGAAPDVIWAVDASSGKVIRRVPLEDSIEVISLGVGFGSVWAGIRHPGYIGAVLRIDPSTGEVLADLPDVDIPARIEIGFGSVWVTDSGSSSVYRIAPS